MAGSPGRGGQLVVEGLFGGAIAETAPGCRVEHAHNADKVVFGQLGQVAIAW
jgi:hypothetical protein